MGTDDHVLRVSERALAPFADQQRVSNATAMIWKLLRVAEKSFRRLKGHDLLPEVFQGKQFVDGFPLKAKGKFGAQSRHEFSRR